MLKKLILLLANVVFSYETYHTKNLTSNNNGQKPLKRCCLYSPNCTIVKVRNLNKTSVICMLINELISHTTRIWCLTENYHIS